MKQEARILAELWLSNHACVERVVEVRGYHFALIVAQGLAPVYA